MNNKTKLYVISGSLIIGILLLLFGINFITGQKNTNKTVKPIASSSEVALVEVPTTVVNTNKGISVSKTIKEISSSSVRSVSSKSTKSSSSTESSSSEVSSSSSANTESELDSRIQWKEDCGAIAARVPQDSKTVYNIDQNKKMIIAPCGTAPWGIQHLVYYYEIDSNGRWISTRQIFDEPNNPAVLLGQGPIFNPSNSELTSYALTESGVNGVNCGTIKIYKFDPIAKNFTLASATTEKQCRN